MKKDSRQILLRLSTDLVCEIEDAARTLGVKRNDALIAAILDGLHIRSCEESFRLGEVVRDVRTRREALERSEECNAGKR